MHNGAMRAAIAFLALLVSSAAFAAEEPVLLPTPLAMIGTGTGFTLVTGTALIADDPGERSAAARFAELMAGRHVRLKVTTVRRGMQRAVRFVRTPGMRAEAYRLVTNGRGATIAASDDAGLLYGATTLWQLATQDEGGSGVARQVPGVTIDDAPRFGWRGLMLDSARHFQSPEYVRRLIDWMAVNKLNRLHWHLVDDQGWRIEIRKYPRLTGVSAWRRPATAPGAPPLPTTGGVYTQSEIRSIVAYAAQRGVTIIPEIELPGHALAAIRAYPALGMHVAIPPGTESDWGVFPWLYNSDDATFTFLENVLKETMALFPSPWIHLGGDEAVKDQWRADAGTQARIKSLGLKDEDALQGWFVARIGRFLAARGRRLIGWDEILDGGAPANATVMSWRGNDGAIAAARAGHDTVLSPAPTLYLDNRQGIGPKEPPGRGNLISLSDILAYDPIPAALPVAQRHHVLGLQANLWTEHVRTERRAAWMTFPRAMAIAETGWAGPAPRTIASFAPALVSQLARMAPLGLAAADSAFAVTGVMSTQGNRVAVSFATQSTLPIRYSTDGSAPTLRSELYGGPIVVASGARVRASTFLGRKPLPGGYDGFATTTAALTRTSRELEPCTSAVLLDLEDDFPAAGNRAHFLLDIFHPCWRWQDAPLEAARGIAVSVGQVPFNFQVGKDRDNIKFRPPATVAGEMEVRLGCDGPRIAVMPLAPAVSNPGVTRLTAALVPAKARGELCITYTARGVNPLWAVERVELLPR